MKIWLQSAFQVGTLKTPRWAVLGLAAIVLIAGTLAWSLKPEQHLIAVNGTGTDITFKTTEQRLGAAMLAQGIQLSPTDRVTPALDTPLAGQKELAVSVRKAVPVTLIIGGNLVESMTAADTVGEMLQELALTPGVNDSVSVDLAAPIQASMAIKIVHRTEQAEIVREEIPFEVVRESDRTMMIGETKDLQAGANGIKEIRKVTYYEDGEPVGTEIVEETVVAEPVDRIVAYGTMGVVSRGGQNYRYTAQMTMESTGYTAGKESNPNGNGLTYTGVRAVRGVVAVDPRVIPLGTWVYVEGYGPAVAADIGGAIKGYKIDLCFDALSEALYWGRRSVSVYILGD